MKLISYAKSCEELETLVRCGVDEVLLGHRALARLGSVDSLVLTELALHAQKLGIRAVLEWDVLMTRAQFDCAIGVLNELNLNLFQAIRVQDAGAFEYVLSNIPDCPIQLNLETGNHNLEAIQRWCSYGGDRLERIILSSQLPKNRLAHDIQNISMPVEVLGLGPILLLYTPRHLLSNQQQTQSEARISIDDTLQALASGEESFHSGFRVIENQQGTLIFHAKDYCLLDQMAELELMGLGALRVDFRLEDSNARMVEAAQIVRSCQAQAAGQTGQSVGEMAQSFIEGHPRKVTRCFFQANATDVLFKKLKNSRIQRKDAGYVGKVMEISRGSHLIIEVLGKGISVKKGQTLKLINPEGEEKLHVVVSLRDIDLHEVDEIVQGDFAVLPYIKLVPPRSVVYLDP